MARELTKQECQHKVLDMLVEIAGSDRATENATRYHYLFEELGRMSRNGLVSLIAELIHLRSVTVNRQEPTIPVKPTAKQVNRERMVNIQSKMQAVSNIMATVDEETINSKRSFLLDLIGDACRVTRNVYSYFSVHENKACQRRIERIRNLVEVTYVLLNKIGIYIDFKTTHGTLTGIIDSCHADTCLIIKTMDESGTIGLPIAAEQQSNRTFTLPEEATDQDTIWDKYLSLVETPLE